MSKLYFKKNSKFLCLVVQTIFLVFFTLNIATAQTLEVRKWAHELSNIKPDPTIFFGKLDNGFRYVLKKNNLPEKRVSILLDVQVGSIYEKEKERGIAHFLEHMVFNGSKNFKPDELVKFFQRIGMSFGPDANAHTGFDETVYKLLLPDNNTDLISEGFMVMRDYADGALLLSSEIDKEKGIILAEKLSRDSSGFRTSVAEINFVYEGSNLGKRFPIGVDEIIKGATAELMRNFYEKWYTAENMVLVVVGDIDIEVVKSIVEKQFSSMKPISTPVDETALREVTHYKDEAFYHYENEAGKVSIGIGVSGNIQPKDDSLEKRKELLSYSLAEMAFGLRLNDEISKAGTSFTDAGFGSGIFLGRYSYSGIDVETSPANWKEALAKSEQMLRQALIYGFTDEEIEIAKKEYRAYLKNGTLSESTRKSTNVSSGLVRDINRNRVSMSPKQKEELYISLLDSISGKMVHDNMKAAWKDKPILITVSGNLDLSGKAMSPEAMIMDEYKSSSSVDIGKPEVVKTAIFPYLETPAEKGVILKREYHDKIDIKTIEFENNVRLNLKKTGFDKDKILITISFGEGRYSEPINKPGLAQVTEAVLDESGFGKISVEELERVLAGKTSSMSFSVKQNSFRIAGRTIPGEEELFFQLAYHQLKDPGYRKNIYDNYILRMKQEYEKYTHTIEGIYTLKVEKFLAGGDHRIGSSSFNEISKISLDDIKQWITPVMKKAPLEINIVGDFDEEKIIDLVSLYFGSLESRDKFVEREYTQELKFPYGQSFNSNIETDIAKSLINIIYPTTDSRNIYEVRRLNMLSKLFNERLRIRIREKLGESYSPFAFHSPSATYKNRGVLSTFVYTSPENIKAVKTEVKNIAAEIVKDGLTEDEMLRISKPMMTAIKDQLKTNRYWLSTVMTGSSVRVNQLKWAESIIKDYESITSVDLANMAKKYLDNKKAATVVISPVEISKEKDKED